ncbi:unnamed protein product [Closterium sp. NIES-53]
MQGTRGVAAAVVPIQPATAAAAAHFHVSKPPSLHQFVPLALLCFTCLFPSPSSPPPSLLSSPPPPIPPLQWSQQQHLPAAHSKAITSISSLLLPPSPDLPHHTPDGAPPPPPGALVVTTSADGTVGVWAASWQGGTGAGRTTAEPASAAGEACGKKFGFSLAAVERIQVGGLCMEASALCCLPAGVAGAGSGGDAGSGGGGDQGRRGSVLLALGGLDNKVHLYTRPITPFSPSARFTRVCSLAGHQDWIRSLDFSLPMFAPPPASTASVASAAPPPPPSAAAAAATAAPASPSTPHVLLASASQDRNVRVWKLALSAPAPAAAGTDTAYSSGASATDSDLLKEFGELGGYTAGPCFQSGGDTWQVMLDGLLVGHEDWVHSVTWHPPIRSHRSIPSSVPVLPVAEPFSPEPVSSEPAASKPAQATLFQPLRLLTSSMDRTMLMWQTATWQGAGGLWLADVSLGEVGHSSLGFFGGIWSPRGDAVLAHGFTGSLHLWRDYGRVREVEGEGRGEEAEGEDERTEGDLCLGRCDDVEGSTRGDDVEGSTRGDDVDDHTKGNERGEGGGDRKERGGGEEGVREREEWRAVVAPTGHFGPVVDMCWDARSQLLLSVSSDQTARIFANWVHSGTPSDVVSGDGGAGRGGASSGGGEQQAQGWRETARPQVHGHDLKCAAFCPSLRLGDGSDGGSGALEGPGVEGRCDGGGGDSGWSDGGADGTQGGAERTQESQGGAEGTEGSQGGAERGLVYVSGAEEKVLRVFESPQLFLDTLHFTRSAASCPSAEGGGASGEGSREGDAAAAAAVPQQGKGVAMAASMSALGLSQKPIYSSAAAAPSDPDSTLASSLGFSQYGDADDAMPLPPAVLQQPPREEQLAGGTLWPEVRKLYGHGNEILCCTASHGGRFLATACKAQSPDFAAIWLWNTPNPSPSSSSSPSTAPAAPWTAAARLSAHTLSVTQMHFSPCDTFLLSVSRDRHLCLFAASHGAADSVADAAAARLTAHTLSVTQMHFSPCDSLLLSVSRDRRFCLFAADHSAADAARLSAHTLSVTQTHFSPCDALLLSVSRDRHFCLFAAANGAPAAADAGTSAPPVTCSAGFRSHLALAHTQPISLPLLLLLHHHLLLLPMHRTSSPMDSSSAPGSAHAFSDTDELLPLRCSPPLRSLETVTSASLLPPIVLLILLLMRVRQPPASCSDAGT